MKIIGCDFHPGFQQISMLEVESQRRVRRKLEHASGEAEQFYRSLQGERVSGGRPTSQSVKRSRLSNAKLRNPPRSRRKSSERCWASSRMTSGIIA